ncbi:MAG: prolipoprotein diacylglyceryl transferase [Thermoleophilia bacterium]|nr:prolipoprotein diacylglyceryl transferase [Thermoleophilia bacterium]
MHPELLHIGSFTLYSYGVMMALAFIAAGFVARWQFKKRGVDPDFIFPLLIAAIVGGLLGAKIHYLIIHPEEWPDNLLSGQGLVWFGGLFGAIAAVVIVTLVSRKPLGAVMDAGAVAVPVGYFFGRMGCFLRGCCHGQPTDLPWGLSFPEGIPPTPPGVKVHPTQLYSGVASLVIFALLAWVIGPRLKRQGSLIFVYALIAGIERFLVEFIRTNEPVGLGLTQQQWIAIAMMIVGVAGTYWFETHGKPRIAVEVSASGGAKTVSGKAVTKR